jgi:hypothetical protein
MAQVVEGLPQYCQRRRSRKKRRRRRRKRENVSGD